MGAGSHIVASTALYGGSQNLLHYTLRRFGIDTTFVKPGDIDGWRAAIRPNTKLLFGETVGNPGLDVLDIPTVSAIAHEAGVPLLVDSTLTSPYLMQAAGAGRRPGLPLGHQVPEWPRHGDWRHRGGRRQL
jgi:O-acetylhomoserine (thiol)-lyase